MLSSLRTFASVVSSHGKRGSIGGGCNLKVMQAKISCFFAGRPEFRRLGQTFISHLECTANIHHVTLAVKAEFGNQYVVVTADGLEVQDSSSTWGTSLKLNQAFACSKHAVNTNIIMSMAIIHLTYHFPV